MQRALGYTAAIRDDEFRLPYREQLILPGRLAALWWKADPVRAKAWLETAVSRVEFLPNQESEDDRRARLGAIRVLLTIAAPLNRGLSDRVLKVMTTEAEKQKDKLTPLERGRLQGDISTAAMAVAADDPERALPMARSLLNMGGAGSLVDTTYSRLHVRNAAVADQFLREAIAAARSAYDPRMLEGISWAAFEDIGLQVDSPTESPVPEELRSAILNVIAEAMLRPAQSEEDQKNICLASLTAARLISKFPPDVGGQVRAAIESCKGKTVPAVARTVDAELSGKFSGSPDELLRAAADESSASTRATMKMQAAVKLEEKDPVRALDVLDSIPPEDRRMIGTRPHLALQAFSAAYRTHDTVAMQRILDHTPDDDRPDVLLNAATVAFRAKDNALGFGYLRDARGFMQKWNPQDDWRPFLTL